MQTLTAIGGHLSLKALQNAFASGMSTVNVLCAFYSDAFDDEGTSNPPDTMAGWLRKSKLCTIKSKRLEHQAPSMKNLEVAWVVDLLAWVVESEVVAEELVEVEIGELLVGATLEEGLEGVTNM
jgi:hypothetical protein